MNKDDHLIYEGYKRRNGLVVDKDGSKKWYKNGELHRDNDEPAVIHADGTSFWYKNGGLHRDGDKPVGIDAEGRKMWATRGYLFHRETGPAIITPSGIPKWFYKGNLCDTPQWWAQLVLRGQGKPTTPQAVEELLKSAYAKAVEDAL